MGRGAWGMGHGAWGMGLGGGGGGEGVGGLGQGAGGMGHGAWGTGHGAWGSLTSRSPSLVADRQSLAIRCPLLAERYLVPEGSRGMVIFQSRPALTCIASTWPRESRENQTVPSPGLVNASG